MDRNHLFVSIIIPCFNEEEYIGRCIDSIKHQHYEGKYEIIVVDNGSTDDTLKIIKDKGITLEHAKKKGPAPVKNKGIERARGEILVFIDGDCVAAEDWLNNIVSGFKNQHTGCVAGEIMADERKNLSVLEQFLNKKGYLSQKQHVEHPFLPYAATANTAYRREVFDKIGFFDESLFVGEDADFSWRMHLFTNYKVTYIPEAMVFHPYESSLKNLFYQKIRHASGSVKTYKKYRKYRHGEAKSLKQTYWEYNSIIRRWIKLLSFKLKKNFFGKSTTCSVNEYQLFLETAWKLGLIHGSLRHRVWKL